MAPVVRTACAVLVLTLLLGQRATGSPGEDDSGSVSLPTAHPIEDVLRGIAERVETARGLDALTEVPVRSVSPEEARAALLGAIEAEDLGRIRAEEALLTRLGLLPPGTDLLALARSLIETDVGGYYRPGKRDIAVIDRDGRSTVVDELLLGHEYVHALQDQHFGLEATREAYPEGDAQMAVTALAEGDAVLAMMDLIIEATTGEEPFFDPGIDRTSQLGSLPLLVEREMLFPYLDGGDFVQRAWRLGGWPGVDEIWRDPPRSTEQILHPERYPDDVPVDVRLPDIADRLGEGWTSDFETTMGELRLGVLVAAGEGCELPEMPLFGIELPNAEAADGWGGDRIVDLSGRDGAWAIAWQITWDTPEDAAEFAAAAREVMPELTDVHVVASGTDIAASAPESQGTLVLVADSASTMADLEAALELG